MEFQDVVQRRRSVRRYDLTRPVPPEVALSNKGAYLDRYAQPDKGFTARSD